MSSMHHSTDDVHRIYCDWNEHKLLIVQSMSRLESAIDRVESQQNEILQEIATIKAKAGLGDGWFVTFLKKMFRA